MADAKADLTLDAFLGGKVQLLQPKSGYRAGVDPVLLAASVPAVAGQRVLELGCGVGAAILCLGARVPGLQLTGIEVQPKVAALAARNGGVDLEVVVGDLADMPLDLRQRQFDHVLANPPYYDRGASVRSDDPAREAAHGEDTPLAVWVKIAAKRLAPKGQLHFIHKVERLPEILGAMPSGIGSLEVLPVAARAGRAPDRVIVRGRKNGRADFVLHPVQVMHTGAEHGAPDDRYVPEVEAVLRHGAALEF